MNQLKAMQMNMYMMNGMMMCRMSMCVKKSKMIFHLYGL